MIARRSQRRSDARDDPRDARAGGGPEQAKQLLNELACSSKSNRSEAPLILL
jgi:hypothetical protein